MTRLFYSWLMWVLQPLLRLKLQLRARIEPLYLEALQERKGHYQGVVGVGEKIIWIHAVSLGETRAAVPLIAGLRARLPGMRLLLTHGTATGREEGKAVLRPGDIQTWQPWDTPAAVWRFLQHFKPSIGILMETEIWPNLVAGCKEAGVPLVLANARLSDKSLRQVNRLSWLSHPTYQALTAVWAQTQGDGQRFATLGAPVQGVFGNLKFDATTDGPQLTLAQSWREKLGRPVVMLASSREGEESRLLQILQSRPKSEVSCQWLIVPRHPQRFDEVADLCLAQGFGVSRRSDWVDGPPFVAELAADIWLGDSLGEMALYYGLADLALLGGSFEPLGGQNLIEAAACACPVLMGPHTFNFLEAAELAQQAGAARRVASLEQAVTEVQTLLRTPEELQAMARAATGFAQAHRGATEQTVAAVLDILRHCGTDRSYA